MYRSSSCIPTILVCELASHCLVHSASIIPHNQVANVVLLYNYSVLLFRSMLEYHIE
jgi:hypothetical protein